MMVVPVRMGAKLEVSRAERLFEGSYQLDVVGHRKLRRLTRWSTLSHAPPRREKSRNPSRDALVRRARAPRTQPKLARQADGSPWEGYCVSPGAPPEQCRVPFYPDASRIFEEIDRLGLGGGGRNNLLGSKAAFDFYRAAPSGGYRKGLRAEERTDTGDGDIPAESWGRDFFTYTPHYEAPAMPTLARLTNVVQRALSSGAYEGRSGSKGVPRPKKQPTGSAC